MKKTKNHFYFFNIIKFTFLTCFILTTLSCISGKRIYINKRTQTLTAYEGTRMILRSPISTGNSDNPTPAGSFKVGVKQKMHHSSLYDNAPMPYSIQFFNNYFIHAGRLPGYPASHGCVRMPKDTAEQLFKWATPGVPVVIKEK